MTVWQDYQITAGCYWWKVEGGTWEEGPAMSVARHRAATLQREGTLWMLGGRTGSAILKTNELIKFPGHYNALDIKHWSWIHKVRRGILVNSRVAGNCLCMQDMLRAAVWEFEVPQAMKELPMSLMGHCALMVNNNLGTVKGLYKGYN